MQAAWRLRRCTALETAIQDAPAAEDLDRMQASIDRARATSQRALQRNLTDLRRIQTERQMRNEMRNAVPGGHQAHAHLGAASIGISKSSSTGSPTVILRARWKNKANPLPRREPILQNEANPIRLPLPAVPLAPAVPAKNTSAVAAKMRPGPFSCRLKRRLEITGHCRITGTRGFSRVCNGIAETRLKPQVPLNGPWAYDLSVSPMTTIGVPSAASRMMISALSKRGAMVRAIDEHTITDAVIDQMSSTGNERLKEIMRGRRTSPRLRARGESGA